MAKHSLYFPFLTTFGLEGGLLKYNDILPHPLFNKDLQLIREWNRALALIALTPEFRGELGVNGRILAALKSPKLVAAMG